MAFAWMRGWGDLSPNHPREHDGELSGDREQQGLCYIVMPSLGDLDFPVWVAQAFLLSMLVYSTLQILYVLLDHH